MTTIAMVIKADTSTDLKFVNDLAAQHEKDGSFVSMLYVSSKESESSIKSLLNRIEHDDRVYAAQMIGFDAEFQKTAMPQSQKFHTLKHLMP